MRRNGVRRTLVVLAPTDRLDYLRLGAAAAATIEAALGDRVVANRVASCSLEPATVVLRPWRVERRAFAAALGELARSNRTLLFTDVAACYASIGPRLVRESLEAIGVPVAGAVEGFLARLAGEGIVGLPVGPEPSALFANGVLARVDAALQKQGFIHLRWVDDLVVGLDHPGEATGALALIGSALGKLGLRLNERKTRIVVDPAALVAVASGLRGHAVRVG